MEPVPGVTSVEAPPAAPAEPIQAPPAAAAEVYEEEQPEGWNWLMIGAGIALGTIFCFSLYYYRYKTRQYSDSVKDQDRKILSLQKEVSEIKNPTS